MQTAHSVRRVPALAIATAALAVLAGACNTKSQAEKIGGVPLSNGAAHVAVTGGTEVSFDAPLEKAQVGTVDTVFVYKSATNDVFSITGLGVNGVAKTNNTLALVVTTGDLLATSSAGECTITILHGDDNAESGTATCSGLDSSKGSIEVNATFSATP